MKFLGVILLFALAYGKHEKYYGWKSYTISTPTKEAQLTFVSLAQTYKVDVLGYPLLQRDGVVIVAPENQEGFIAGLEKYNIKYAVHRNDLKEAFDYDDLMIEKQRNTTRNKAGAGKMSYDNYQDLDVIYAYLDDIAERYPDIVTLVTPANSFEGRPIKYLKISTSNFEDESKPLIVIDATIHAREWIAPPTATYAIKKLVEDRDQPDLIEKFDWIILPVANPDGYKYSFTNDRMWRMTRSTDQHLLSGLCPGVDGNRNYDFFWNTVGTSLTPCSQTYPGNKPFSEIETRVVRDILQTHLHRIALYLTMHSFGSMILYPWGHDGSLSNNALALHVVGVAMAQAIDKVSLPSFPNYLVGNAVLTLGYGASGASEDYAHLIGVPLSYTYELPGFGWGTAGFHLDPIYIEQVSIETWAGIEAGVRSAGDLFVRR